MNGTDGNVKNKSACGKLTKDIVVNDIEDVYDIDFDDVEAVVQWNPLDTFAGTFDGNGHTISGLVRNVAQETDPQDVGFIRVLVANPETPTVVKNLGLVKSMFYAKNSDVAMGIFAVRVVDSDLEDGADSYARIVNCFNQSVAYFKNDGERSYLVRYVGRHAVLTIENSYNVGKGNCLAVVRILSLSRIPISWIIMSRWTQMVLSMRPRNSSKAALWRMFCTKRILFGDRTWILMIIRISRVPSRILRWTAIA